jgi:hypothetical protein
VKATVNDVIDSPELRREVERISYESDLRVLAIYQERVNRDADAPPVPKALWRRIMRYRRSQC